MTSKSPKPISTAPTVDVSKFAVPNNEDVIQHLRMEIAALRREKSILSSNLETMKRESEYDSKRLKQEQERSEDLRKSLVQANVQMARAARSPRHAPDRSPCRHEIQHLSGAGDRARRPHSDSVPLSLEHNSPHNLVADYSTALVLQRTMRAVILNTQENSTCPTKRHHVRSAASIATLVSISRSSVRMDITLTSVVRRYLLLIWVVS